MRERAIRLVFDIEQEAGSMTAACRRIGEELGINSDTLRGWVKQAQVDSGKRPGDHERGCGPDPRSPRSSTI